LICIATTVFVLLVIDLFMTRSDAKSGVYTSLTIPSTPKITSVEMAYAIGKHADACFTEHLIGNIFAYDSAVEHSIIDGVLIGDEYAIKAVTDAGAPFWSKLTHMDMEPILDMFPHKVAIYENEHFKGPVHGGKDPKHNEQIVSHQAKTTARILYYGDLWTCYVSFLPKGLPFQAYVGKDRQKDSQAEA
jgi:hypothetical protein